MDASDRKAVIRAQKAAAMRDRQDRVTLTNFMSTIAGRQFIYHKLLAAHVFTTSFTTNGLQMAFNEGERNQGLLLFNDLMAHCPDQYILMMREANARSTANELAGSSDTGGDDYRATEDGDASGSGTAEGRISVYDEFERALADGRIQVTS